MTIICNYDLYTEFDDENGKKSEWKPKAYTSRIFRKL
jgi:hypothetical protein